MTTNQEFYPNPQTTNQSQPTPSFQSLTDRLPDSPIRLSDITRILRKYGIYVLGMMILGATLATIWAKFQPKQYDAIAMVHLDQHSSISLSASGGASDEYGLKMQTQMIGFQSARVAELTIRQLGLQNNPMFNPSGARNLDDPIQRDQLVRTLLGSLSVTQVSKTELLSIRFRSRSPALSALVANTLVDTYIHDSFTQRYKSTKGISDYLTLQLEDLRGKIQTEQNQLLSAEAKLGILSTGEKGESSLLIDETTGLLGQRVKIQGDRFLAEAELQNLKAHPESAPPPDIPGAAELGALQGQLLTAQGQVASLEDRYGPNYPPLSQARAQVESLRKSFSEATQKVTNAAQANLDRSKKTEQSVNDRLTSLQKQAEGRTPDTVRYEILKSQYVSDQTLYNVLLSAMGTGGIQTALQSQELNNFSAAEVPGVSAYPNVRVDALAGATAGLLFAAVIIGVLVLNSDTVQTVEQIEDALPLPILASVPEYKDDLVAMRMSEDVLPLVTLLAPRSAGTEAYRLLRTAISLMPVRQKHRVISLSSCGPGEGKSTTSLNLAIVLATQSKRVLLIDADLRKPTIAQRLKLPPSDQPGLSRYLSDSTVNAEDCIQRVSEVAGLDVIPVQEVPPFPSELLGQGRLEELLNWARDHYDYVLIDTPPVLLVTDALIIASHCDTLLVVVRIGIAQKRALRRIRQDLAKYPGKQTGIVVNALPHSDTYYGGYGNYRTYYGKGYGSGGYYGSGSSNTPTKKQ